MAVGTNLQMAVVEHRGCVAKLPCPQAWALHHALMTYGHQNIKVLVFSVLHVREPAEDRNVGTDQKVIEGIFYNNTRWIRSNLDELLHEAHAIKPGGQRNRIRDLMSPRCVP